MNGNLMRGHRTELRRAQPLTGHVSTLLFSERARFGDLTGVLCAGNPMWSHRFRPGDVPSLRNLPRREARGVWPGRTARPAQAVPAHISSRVRAKVPTLSMYFPGAFYVGSAPGTKLCVREDLWTQFG